MRVGMVLAMLVMAGCETAPSGGDPHKLTNMSERTVEVENEAMRPALP